MAITTEEARDLVESVFDFDHVGSEMIAVRKNLDSKEAQEALISELVSAATAELKDSPQENLIIISTAARDRVGEFVKGAKFSQSGCTGL
ncbi:MAG TPA: hypothetical protein VHO84_14075 [Syntrophorhabdaceae bacterium]|nr:hypothetical protein [Syntrophorhabdaceae bacterium]